MVSANILFLGGAGFIGSSIIKEMMKTREITERIYVLEPSLADLSRLEGLNINIIRGTLSNTELIETVIKSNNIRKVVHLVSSMVPGSGYEEYKQEFENVIFPTIRLMQLCSRLGILFVFFSSGGTVYGERKTIEPFVETDPKEPISYYGLSKQMIENSIQFEHRVSGLQYLVVRPSNPYGHGQSINGRQGLIAVSIGKILSNEILTIWGDGSSVRDYIYIDDLTNAFCKLLETDVINTTINIGSGVGYSVKQVLNIIGRVTEEELKVEYTPSRKNDVSNMILDTTLLKTFLNLKLTPIEEGIRLFYEYEKTRLRHE